MIAAGTSEHADRARHRTSQALIARIACKAFRPEKTIRIRTSLEWRPNARHGAAVRHTKTTPSDIVPGESGSIISHFRVGACNGFDPSHDGRIVGRTGIFLSAGDLPHDVQPLRDLGHLMFRAKLPDALARPASRGVR